MKALKYIVLLIGMLAVFSLYVELTQPVNATVNGYGTIRKWTGLSTDSKPAAGATGCAQGDEFWELDSGNIYVYNGSAWSLAPLAGYTFSAADDSLTAPGNSIAVFSRGYAKGGFLFTISAINTTVSCALQGKVGAHNWTSIDTDSTQYTANGDEGLIITSTALYDSLRLQWIAESGGTAALIHYTPTLAK